MLTSSLSLSLLLLLLSPLAPAPQKAPGGRPEPILLPGWRPDGSVLLPNQWSLRPAGRQLVLGDFPVNMAVHPGGRFVAVLHCGYGPHEIVVVEIPEESSSSDEDTPAPHIVSRLGLPQAFYGIVFSEDGSRLFCSGAGDEVVHVFKFKEGYLSEPRQIALHDATTLGVPSGLALDPGMSRLYAVNVLGHMVTEVDLDGETRRDIPLTQVSAVSAHKVSEGSVKAEPSGQGTLHDHRPDPHPYDCALDWKRQRLYVSLWARSAVAVIDLKTRRIIARWPTEDHPNEMLLSRSGDYLYVANANRNTVTLLDTRRGIALETLSTSLYPASPPGTNPSSLALSPAEDRLFVANSNNNNVAVFDVRTPGKSKSMGFIPVGWYPTSVRVTPDGKHLLVANGKGLISKANRNGPRPGSDLPKSLREYIGSLLRGTLSVIDIPGPEEFRERLATYTRQAFQSSPFKPPGKLSRAAGEGHPIPLQPGISSPIRYCIYVIKENRTYDQVLGDIPEGNGEPSLCLFPETVTPNHHRLARDFVLLDNFYVDAEVSADGHEWSMGAYATDFVEKFWPLNYGHGNPKYPYPSEGRFELARPAGGYLWDRAREAGISYRSYGEFVETPDVVEEHATTQVAALQGHFDPWYRPWDLDYLDVKRVQRFQQELKRFEAEGEMPRLQIVRLGNDHTYGTRAGKRTPTAMVADNDLALGKLVEAVSHSRFWPETAIFVLEDDAQNGPDHVDAHRSVAFVISPFAKRGSVDSTMYSTSSMLHTLELILGLEPMSQYDAAARPMFNSFQPYANLRPYRALPVNVDLNERNQESDWGSRQSARMDFSKADAIDDLLLNAIVWKSVRGSDHPVPPPHRAAFVFLPLERDEE
ncbi:MAG: bifunctional YncE family protein/alkaline phosphatase family protein [Acidobacteriota bacterium]